MTITNKKFGRVTLTLDTSDAATPCMVYVGRASSTYWCAQETACVGNDDEVALTAEESNWLDMQEEYCVQCEEIARTE